MLRIKDVVRGLSISGSTVRNWTKVGFLPDRRDKNNRRYFLEEDIAQAKKRFYGKEIVDGEMVKR